MRVGRKEEGRAGGRDVGAQWREGVRRGAGSHWTQRQPRRPWVSALRLDTLPSRVSSALLLVGVPQSEPLTAGGTPVPARRFH